MRIYVVNTQSQTHKLTNPVAAVKTALAAAWRDNTDPDGCMDEIDEGEITIHIQHGVDGEEDDPIAYATLKELPIDTETMCKKYNLPKDATSIATYILRRYDSSMEVDENSTPERILQFFNAPITKTVVEQPDPRQISMF